MAKINLAPFISSISGRMGGVVYKNTRFGTALSAYESPSNPNTAAQRAVRNSFTKATQAWRNLTPAQAGAWNTWASTYGNSNWSGFNWFVSFTSKWYAVNGFNGHAPVNPPSNWFNGDNISVKATASNGKITWTASGSNASGVTTALVYQRVSGPNSTPNWNNFKTAKYNSFSNGSFTTSFNVAPGYYAVGYYFVNTKTGQAMSPVYQAGILGPVSFTVVTGGNTSTSTKKRTTAKKRSSKKASAKKSATKRTAPAAKASTAKPALKVTAKKSTSKAKTTKKVNTSTKPTIKKAASKTIATPAAKPAFKVVAKKSSAKSAPKKSTTKVSKPTLKVVAKKSATKATPAAAKTTFKATPKKATSKATTTAKKAVNKTAKSAFKTKAIKKSRTPKTKKAA